MLGSEGKNTFYGTRTSMVPEHQISATLGSFWPVSEPVSEPAKEGGQERPCKEEGFNKIFQPYTRSLFCSMKLEFT